MATLRDVARELGLSISTVSRALNGYPHIDERTRARVQRAAKALNYQPNALARALRQQETKTVGLIIPDILNLFYAEGAAVLQATLEEHGYRLVVCISNDNPDSDRSYLEALLQQRVDGIVHVPCTVAGARMVRDSSMVPLVELNRCSDGGLFDAVLPDDRDGALRLTRYLLGLGHTRIAVIAGPEQYSTTIGRIAGVQEAYREAGVSFDELLIIPGQYTPAWGAEATRHVIAMERRPTAILAAGNQIVLGALQVLGNHRLRIPSDISLAGFDDPGWFAAWQPGITTYALPLREMGLVAAQLLLSRMTLPKDSPSMATVTRLAGQLIVRESCARPDMGEQKRIV